MTGTPGQPDSLDIPELKPGEADTLLSASRGNQIIRCVNAWRKARIVRGPSDAIFVSQGNVIIQLRASEEATGGGTGTGNVNFQGLYSAGTDYAANDLVYTSPDSRTRVAWICLIANGPATAVHSPAWPEPGSVYWRAISNVGQLTQLSYVSMQNDYLICNDSLGATVNVAKPPMLRFSVGSRVERGVGGTATITFATYDLSGQSRYATNTLSAVTGFEVISPQYNNGDVIYAQSVDHTGVSVSGSELKLIDTNIDQRRWLLAYGQ